MKNKEEVKRRQRAKKRLNETQPDVSVFDDVNTEYMMIEH
jgi:hypothetical protein